jgi:hypothetical protein
MNLTPDSFFGPAQEGGPEVSIGVASSCPLAPFPMRKWGTEAEGSRGPIFQLLILGAELVLSVAEGGHACRRKCETYRGFHVQ